MAGTLAGGAPALNDRSSAPARQRALDPQCRIERLHFYPFGGLARTARWIEAIRAGAFTLHDDGFTVDRAAV